MLKWSEPETLDGEWIRAIISQSNLLASDVSFANIYLLRNKYQTLVCSFKDYLIRYYQGKDTRAGYTFPIGKGDIRKALLAIEKDAMEQNRPFQFCLLTEQQKDELVSIYPDRFELKSDAGDSDYVYAQQELANLSGKAFHKKKNHYSKFVRTYPDYQFVRMNRGNLADAQLVQDAWYCEHLQSEDESQMAECVAIREALCNFDDLQLFGGILYCDGVPVAMTIASAVSRQVVDIHYEKVIGEYAMNGGYAAINKCFAESLNEFQWINREEDIGIEGLRRAKMSYHPKIMVKKYLAKLKGEQ